MTSTARPHNATPQKLSLKPPQIPRMPFSSPIGEEVLSPTSDPSHTPPQSHNDREMQSQARQSPQTTQRRNVDGNRGVSPSSRGVSGASRNESPGRPKWPGLNVITDFKKGVEAITNPGRPQVQPLRAAETRPAVIMARGERSGSDESLQARAGSRVGHKRSGRSLKGSGSKGRLDDLKHSSTKSSNLSPSDRAVMIGISVDPDEVDQEVTPGREHTLDSAQNERARRISMVASIAPSIIVTPAHEHAPAPWNTQEKKTGSPPRRRPSSSVYSHIPAPSDPKSSTIPPVPPIPATAGNPGGKPKEALVDERRPREMSTCTIFDEEPSPDAPTRSRPGSRESQLHILEKVGTGDTVATKRRSQGWWNVLKSPFFPKSPLNLKFPQQYPGNTAPPIPTSRGRAASDPQQSDMSPGSPPRYRKSQVASTHTSWTDSSLEAECEKRALDFGEAEPASAPKSAPPLRMPRESYYIAERFEGLGAASEYYHACHHDMYSGEPYFECQNHKCWPSTLGIGGYVARGTEGPGSAPLAPPPVNRGEPLDIEHTADKDLDKRLKPAPLQVPANRFSAAFGEAIDPPKDKAKHQSEATTIDDIEATPVVREAKAAPILKAPSPKPTVTLPARKDSLARQPSTIHSSPYFNKPDPSPKALPTPPPRLPNKNSPDLNAHREATPEPEPPRKPWISGLPSNPRHKTLDQPMSPQPLTPGAQRHAPVGAIHLAEVHETRQSSPGPSHAPTHTTNITNHYYNQRDRRNSRSSVTTADLWPPPRPPRPVESLGWWQLDETNPLPPRTKPKPKATALLERFKSCTQGRQKRTYTSAKPVDKKKRRRLIIVIGIALLLLVILILVLAMTLTHRGDRMSAQSQWLNITGYPPVPTGFSTIAQPDAALEESGCVQPTSMWSCALPKEDQGAIAPNAPDQPNFRVEIRFQNGTNATTGNISNLDTRSIVPSNAVTAGQLMRSKILKIRDAFNSGLYNPDPAPPSDQDQTFLGNTTDGNRAPFDGEYTPFFMTFHPSDLLPSRLLKRKVLDTSSDDGNSSSGNDSFPDIAGAIPSASTNPDGTASPAQLYPFPSAQPLRLFNRGRSDEHYGFYTYFSRSIFLESTTPLNASIITGNTPPTEPADADGGSLQKEASVRCTWTQTRFLVQVWTNKGPHPPLLSGNGTLQSNSHSGTSKTKKGENSTESSANDFQRPGSFPYPISITVDRHGGNIEKKMIYCYGLDNDAKPIPDAKKLQLEDRAFGAGSGGLVNPAQGPWKDVKVKTEDGGPGGIDGGSGGCGCRWQNWR